MNPEIQEIIERITANKAKRGSKMQPPCNEEELRVLAYGLQKSYGIALPEQYETLLRMTDGIDFNGTLIFAAVTRPHASLPGKTIEGLLEANVIRRKNAEQFLVFGESSMEMYVLNLVSNDWQIVDQVSLDSYEVFKSFDHLVIAALAQRLT